MSASLLRKTRLALVFENHRDTDAGLALNLLVAIDKGDAQCFGQQATNSALAGAHRSNQVDAGAMSLHTVSAKKGQIISRTPHRSLRKQGSHATCAEMKKPGLTRLFRVVKTAISGEQPVPVPVPVQQAWPPEPDPGLVLAQPV